MLPLPKIVRPHEPVLRVAEGNMSHPAFLARRRSVIQGNLQQHKLHSDRKDSLREERNGIVVAEPEKYPAAECQHCSIITVAAVAVGRTSESMQQA